MKPTCEKKMSKAFSLIFFILFLISNNSFCQKNYTVNYFFSGKDTLYNLQQLGLKTSFNEKESAQKFIATIPGILSEKGFPGASVDSVFYDSALAKVDLYLGEKMKWLELNTDSVDQDLLNSIGWGQSFFAKKVSLRQFQLQKEKIIDYYQNSGFPFAAVFLENIHFSDDNISADLVLNKGILYHIDSIHVFGNVKIKNQFLQNYLGIENGSVYDAKKLNEVSKLLAELPFLQEQQKWKLSMLGSGAFLNLYLKEKRSSQANVLIGFLPGNSLTGKAKITADVHLDLKNALGAGENILLNWQQLQPQSPRLNLGYSHPYIFNSDFGIDLSFDLLKRDSNYLQLNSIAGLQYNISSRQSLKVFYQNENSYLLSGSVDTNVIIVTKKLPANVDVSSGNFGLNYQFANTNYKFNPRKGNEFTITASAGLKKIKKNNDIITLKDPQDPGFDFHSLYDTLKLKSYRVRLVSSLSHFFPLGKNNTLKIAGSFGLIASPQTFRNELFQIGGYRLLRGFDEESIYANRYEVFTVEYRYLVGLNSYFFGFSDIGFTNTKFNANNFSNSFASGGIGLEFETKFGLLNLSYAAGKRNDVKFNIRNSSRIHFGYINYF